ncbi:hypothetical protein ABPG74_006186 [Tetrahymena malaccensis]
MQKILICLLISLVVFSQARIGGPTKIGGWNDYDLEKNNDYKLNSQSPLNMIYKLLLQRVQKFLISNINFYHVQTQLVNGMNYKIEFSYEQGNQTKNGMIQIYVPINGTPEFTIVKLQPNQEKLGQMVGGWQDYEIDTGFQSKPDSLLFRAFQSLSKELKQKNVEFVRFDSIQSKIVSGILLKVTFTYEINGEEKSGSCQIYDVSWEKITEVSDLQLEDENLISEQDNNNQIIGGYSTFEYQQDYLTNSQNELYPIFKELLQSLKKVGLFFHNLITVERQLVNGFNYRISFSYLKLDGTIGKGQVIIYLPFEGKPQVTSLKFDRTLTLGDNGEGQWQDMEFDQETLKNPQSGLGQAYKKLIEELVLKSLKIQKILKVAQQIVSGVNYRIIFQYGKADNLKTGEAVIFVQPWTKTIEIKSLNFNIQTQA